MEDENTLRGKQSEALFPWEWKWWTTCMRRSLGSEAELPWFENQTRFTIKGIKARNIWNFRKYRVYSQGHKVPTGYSIMLRMDVAEYGWILDMIIYVPKIPSRSPSSPQDHPHLAPHDPKMVDMTAPGGSSRQPSTFINSQVFGRSALSSNSIFRYYANKNANVWQQNTFCNKNANVWQQNTFCNKIANVGQQNTLCNKNANVWQQNTFCNKNANV